MQTYLLIGYIIVMVTGRLVSQRQRRNTRSFLAQSRAITTDWTAWLVAVSAAVTIALPVLEAALEETTRLKVYMVLAGLVFIVVGWWVAYVANRTLGASWSPTIDKAPEQQLVTVGIYSVVRHPLYLAGLLVLIGTNLYFQSRWAWIGVLVALVVILIRVPIEEKRLVDWFGPAYIEYRKRTKAVLPWIL